MSIFCYISILFVSRYHDLQEIIVLHSFLTFATPSNVFLYDLFLISWSLFLHWFSQIFQILATYNLIFFLSVCSWRVKSSKISAISFWLLTTLTHQLSRDKYKLWKVTKLDITMVSHFPTLKLCYKTCNTIVWSMNRKFSAYSQWEFWQMLQNQLNIQWCLPDVFFFLSFVMV